MQLPFQAKHLLLQRHGNGDALSRGGGGGAKMLLVIAITGKDAPVAIKFYSTLG